MLRSIDQRPELSERFADRRRCTQEACTNSKENAAAQAEALSLLTSPWEGLKRWKPGVLQAGQFLTGNATWNELTRNRLQARLSRCRDSLIEIVEPLAPPGQANCSKTWIRASRH